MSLADNLKRDIQWLRQWQRDEFEIPKDAIFDDAEPSATSEMLTELTRMNAGHDKPKYAADEIEFMQLVADRVVNELAAREVSCLLDAGLMCGSPIERIFISAFWLTCLSTYMTLSEGRPAVLLKCGHATGTPFGPDSVTIEPQASIGTYRVDFRITRMQSVPDFDHEDENGIPGVRTHRREIIVECDGHNFHERTKEQAAHDKGRDRELQAVGYRVFHFTGSEIWNKPVQCAKEVIDVLDNWSKD